MRFTMNKVFLASVLSLVTAFTLAACQKKETSTTSATSTPEGKEVNLAIWSNYVTPEMIAEFEKESGLKVNISNYSSNEELMAKLKAGSTGIDLAVPSDYMVFAMAQTGMLETLDTTKISNFKNLDSSLLGKEYDPKNSYSLPFNWGTTGIAINTKIYKGDLKGWKDLFSNKALAGKFTMLDDVRESLGAALKSNGFSLNSTNVEEIKKAQATLDSARSKIKGFTSETLMGLVNGEMAVAHAYSCDALQARAKLGGNLKYILPEEGCTLWFDNLVIPKGNQNLTGAYKLMDYLLSSKVGAERAKNLVLAPSNKEAMALMPENLRNDPALFPPKDQLAKCEMLKDVGETLVTFDEAWTALKASAK